MKEIIISFILTGTLLSGTPTHLFYPNTYQAENTKKIEILEKQIYNKFIKTNKEFLPILYELGFETPEPNYITLGAPNNSSFKSYMPYTAITNKSSNQYKLQCQAYTGDYGIRMVDDRYCIAMGSYYSTQIGTRIDLIMQNGSVVKCILADCKSDIHTDSNNQRCLSNNSVVEFIVDKSSLNKTAKQMGNISYADEQFEGDIKEVKIYK